MNDKFLTETTQVINGMVDSNQRDMNEIKDTLHAVLDDEDPTWCEIVNGPDRLNEITQEYCSTESTQLEPTGEFLGVCE